MRGAKKGSDNQTGKDNEKLEIIAQMSGYKNLKIEGGFRLQLDIFEARERDVAALALLVNRRKVVKVAFEPYEEKNGGDRN